METKSFRVSEICPTSAQTRIKKGAILVDVRERAEVDQLAFDVPEFIHIPLSELELRFRELPADKELVMVCSEGLRSFRAAGFLINAGFDPDRVVNMKYGMKRWVQKGFPVKGDSKSFMESDAGITCCGTTVENRAEVSSCCGHTADDNSSCC